MKIAAQIFIVIFVFVSGFYIGQKSATPTPATDTCPSPGLSVVAAEPARLMIDYGNGRLDTYSLELTTDTNVFELLEKFTSEQEIALKFKDYGGEMGVFVEAIGGIENDFSNNRYWQYWVNNNYAQVGPGQQRLGSGDQIEWKFIAGQFNE